MMHFKILLFDYYVLVDGFPLLKIREIRPVQLARK